MGSRFFWNKRRRSTWYRVLILGEGVPGQVFGHDRLTHSVCTASPDEQTMTPQSRDNSVCKKPTRA